MRNIYSGLLLLLAAVGSSPCASFAQNSDASASGSVYVGYAQLDETIYEYDGLSLDHDARVGCAIKVTPQMLAPYAGGKVVAMRVGWDTSAASGRADCFVRLSLNGEDVSTGSGTVTYDYSRAATGYGWNRIAMSEYVIPAEPDTLVCGFYTNLKKDVCAIPTLYPHYTPNSCFLWVEGDVDKEGKPVWTDLNDRGILPILLVVQDKDGTFGTLATVTMLNADPISYADEPADALMRIRNLGSQPIRSIELTTTLGNDAWSQTVELSSPVAVGKTSGAFPAPVYCFKTGTDTLRITKVNGEDNLYRDTVLVPMLGVPELVADGYERRPLLEYYVSENSYMYPRYFDEYVKPGLEGVEDRLTLVLQHADDQFMTGEDDATQLLLDFWENAYQRVSIPATTLDRSAYVSNPQYQSNQMTNPVYDTLMPLFAGDYYDAVLQIPTFASVEAQGWAENDALSVSIGGNVAPGILPEGEKPRLTVYLMERNVVSDSQLFWTEKEKEAHQASYTHPNVVREVLTEGLYGTEIETDAAGNYRWQGATELYPEYNKENLYLVAFVNRTNANGVKERNVINSCEGSITFNGTGISEAAANSPKAEHRIFDLQGRRICSPANGVFIVDGKKVIR